MRISHVENFTLHSEMERKRGKEWARMVGKHIFPSIMRSKIVIENWWTREQTSGDEFIAYFPISTRIQIRNIGDGQKGREILSQTSKYSLWYARRDHELWQNHWIRPLALELIENWIKWCGVDLIVFYRPSNSIQHPNRRLFVCLFLFVMR